MERTTIPLAEIEQRGASWIDCTVGGVVCPVCDGYVGQLDVFGDEATCDECGRRFRLVVAVEVSPPDPRAEAETP